MTSHWIVIADAANVRIFEADETLDRLVLVEQLEHPESKQKAADLVSDDRGRARTYQGGHNAYERHTDPHRATVHAFAHALGAKLRAAQLSRAYDRLILVAPPQFLGELRGELGGAEKAVVASIAKDLTQVPVHELAARVRADLPPTAGMPER